MLEIYTDGSSHNPSKTCGWAFYLPGEAYHENGYLPGTNNVGELFAIQKAISYCLEKGIEGEEITIFTDSQYAMNATDLWCHDWKRRGWRRSNGKPVENLEIIKRNVELAAEVRKKNKLHFKWVRGHSGNENNEIVDRLASVYNWIMEDGTRIKQA